ncbi:MAG: hypothetical protein A2008_09930 [Candidatus Wallbacteria bacterium GWC2_49_35]|uniref:Uncharacterized protein n=1 Tax=Candidatus Wallbacteria bacterium GWC2_49_35 TaxID=1817813 RepID=A0A1F7WDS0_9BACT|nr:MAG: hypothetical protein A2008_09930 [Candidatus Wallbacteria bacterium GWC2_49_35]
MAFDGFVPGSFVMKSFYKLSEILINRQNEKCFYFGVFTVSRNIDSLICLNALKAQTRSVCACCRDRSKGEQLKNKKEVYDKTERARRLELKPGAESGRQIELKRQAIQG